MYVCMYVCMYVRMYVCIKRTKMSSSQAKARGQKHTAYSSLLLPKCLSEAKVQNGRACRTLDAAIPVKAVEQDHLDCDRDRQLSAGIQSHWSHSLRSVQAPQMKHKKHKKHTEHEEH